MTSKLTIPFQIFNTKKSIFESRYIKHSSCIRKIAKIQYNNHRIRQNVYKFTYGEDDLPEILHKSTTQIITPLHKKCRNN